MPQAVDLFCGAGALTLGLKRAGFNVVAAVESDPLASATYAANHASTKLISADIRTVAVQDVQQAIGRRRRLDLLTACPPCQGFTSLTSKHNRDDPRNKLVREVLRFAEGLRPRVIMLENVTRLSTSASGSKKLTPLLESLRRLGYTIEVASLQAADFGTAQMRQRLVVFASQRGIGLPQPSHSRDGEKLPRWRTVRDAIGTFAAPSVYDRHAPVTKGTLAEWHVVRQLGQLNLDRLRAARPGAARRDLPEELRPACHKGSDTGFQNVYGRMVWDKPAPTITGGCTSPSKGRFGHPRSLRTISVAEAGVLQDLPEDYMLASNSIDRACVMIGNALPVRLAEASARHALLAL